MQKTCNNDRKIGKMWRNVDVLGIICFCPSKLSNLFLSECQFFFFKPSYSRQVRYILSPTCCVGEMRIWGVRGCVSIIHHLSVAPSWRAETLTCCMRVSPQNLCSLFIIMFSFDLSLYQRPVIEKAHFWKKLGAKIYTIHFWILGKISLIRIFLEC